MGMLTKKRSLILPALLLAISPSSFAAEETIDTFASPGFVCPLGGAWRAESDASMGGSSTSRLVWVKKVVRAKKPAAVKGEEQGKGKKPKEKPDGFLRLEFELKPNPQVSRPDAAAALSLAEAADFSRGGSISMRVRCDIEEGECLGMLVAEVLDENTGLWKPVACGLDLGTASTAAWMVLPLRKFRAMRWWGKLHAEHGKTLDWSKVRSLKIMVLSKKHCKGKVTIDEIKLIQ